ncbi:MAG: hypothetical protein KKA54_01685 [Proteobacteria bacterium]|nr:hypothetical protein [Pseudomonadota bacterium]
MSKPTRVSHPMYNLLPTEIEGFDSLAELDIAQVPADQVVYIENTPIFIEIAAGLGILCVLHTSTALWMLRKICT